jgi:hypothetical protein
MRKWPLILILFLICACGSKQQVPEWKDTSARQLESYKYSFLTDRESSSEPHFLKAKKSIARSNDLNLLGTAYLTRYALYVSIFEDFDDADFLRINKLQPNAKNFAYYNFIKGNFHAVDYHLLPLHYSKLIKPAQDKDLTIAVREIGIIDDPLSRLVACGVWVKYLPYDDNLLQIAINTAAENGWGRPLFAYLNKLQQYYLDHNETVKGAAIKDRLELLKK